MASLRQLEASFLRVTASLDPLEKVQLTFRQVEEMRGAHGVWFLCPKCFAENGGPEGTHAVICWFRGLVPDDLDPKPGRWNPSGTGLDDLTFVPPGAVSVQLLSGCGWHGFVKNGQAE